MTSYEDVQDLTQHTKVGKFYKTGNDMTMQERQDEKLMWERPMFKQERAADYQPGRLSYDMKRLRSDETVGYGKRRQTETRKFKHDFPEHIKEMQNRIKREEEEKNKEKGPKVRMRWWWKKTAVELRDPLKMLRMNNFTFKPEELMTAKDIVFLQLTGCRLGDDAMSWVSAFMQQSYTLKRISLQANQITAEGCNEIFLGLRTTKTLMEFDISMNPIGDDGCATICNALNENSRWSKVYTLNMSCCKLSPNAGFHLGRLIRDFKPLQALLVWRNNLGCMTPAKIGGISLILEELRSSSTMKLLNFTCNEISDTDAAAHANYREVEMRRRSTLENDKKQLQYKIEDLQKVIKVKRREAVWDDQRVEIAGMEKELNETKSKLRVAASLEARSRTKAQKAELDYQDRVRKGCAGEELVLTRVKPRLILTGNNSIRRMTLVRLSAFYDLADAPDAEEFVSRKRRFDNVVFSRRQVGEEYTGPRDTEAYDEHNVFKWDVTFDANADHARRTIVLDWREEQRIAALNATAVKFDKFALSGSTKSGAPTGKDGKALQMRSGGVTVASNVNDNIRDEKAGDRDRLAQKKEALRIRQEEATKGKITKKVAVEQEVEVDVARVGNDGKAQSTRTTDKNTIKGTEKSEVSVAEFKKLESELPPPRSAGSKAEPDPAEDEEGDYEYEYDEDQNDAEGFDFDNYEENAEHEMLDQLLGRETENKSEATKLAERNEQRMAELKAKMEQKVQTTPRTEAAQKLVVASSADVATNLGGNNSSMGDGSFGRGGGSVLGSSGNAKNSGPATPRSEPTSPTTLQASKQASVTASVLQMVTETSVADLEGPPVVPMIPNVSPTDVTPETRIVMDSIKDIEAIKLIVQTLSEKGSPSDEDLANLEKEKLRLAKNKLDAAIKISGFSTPAVIGTSHLTTFWDFIDALIRETDIPQGNAELLAAFLLKAATDYPALIEERGLAAMAAADSSISYLKLLLSVPEIRLDTVDVVSSCFFNQTARIPLSHLILSQPASVIDIEGNAEDLSFMWQEFFEDCASKKRSIPREDRTGRMELLTIMLDCPHLDIDIEADGNGDGQSLVFRAAAEGDLALMDLLLANKTLKEPNVPKAALMTVFHAAVVGNEIEVVKLLLDRVPSIDLTLASANGNAMDLAVNLGRDPAIVKFLEGKGLKKTGHVSKVKAPTKAPAKKAVGKKTVKKPVAAAAAKTVAKPKPKAKAGAKK